MNTQVVENGQGTTPKKTLIQIAKIVSELQFANLVKPTLKNIFVD